MAVDFDRNLIGKELDHAVYPPVTREEIVEYATLCGETNPLFTDEAAARRGPYGTLVAPPTFVVRLREGHFTHAQLSSSFRTGFDAGKDIEFGEPVRPGDVLTFSAKLHDVYEKTGRSGDMVFFVLRTTVTNQRGEMVAVIDQRMMVR